MGVGTLEAFPVTTAGAQELNDVSLALATGARYLGGQAARQITIERFAGPAGAWGARVDEVEAPFAEKYDEEEYQGNEGLAVLNMQELAMLFQAWGVAPPWATEVTGRELADKKLLDVGVGTGRIAIAAAVYGAKVTAFDQTLKYVEETGRKMRFLPPTAPTPRLLEAPAEALAQMVNPEDRPDLVTAMFGVLNHCENWQGVIRDIGDAITEDGTFVLSMYGSPDAIVYEELKTGMSYAPAILTRRAEGGLLLGDDASDILPAKFPYPEEIVAALEAADFEVVEQRGFLAVTSLFPRDPSPENITAYLGIVERQYGPEVSSYLAQYAADPKQLLMASMYADYEIPQDKINDAAYVGFVARKKRVES